jgi:hypothetical protein
MNLTEELNKIAGLLYSVSLTDVLGVGWKKLQQWVDVEMTRQ